MSAGIARGILLLPSCAARINRPGKKIDELEKAIGTWVEARYNNWATLYLDSTRYYTR